VLVLERGHEQPAVTPVDARFDEIVQMPHESPWPPILALALSLVFIMLVIGRYGIAGIMGIFCLLALVGWHSTEPQEQ
jgi:cytochrome c oxidase subunit 1/cytochrome c oxidase subunit I+III